MSGAVSSAATFADLRGRRAVVTGASSGIGRAIALELARAGADLVLHFAKNEAGIRETAAAVLELGRTATTHQADFADQAATLAFADAVLSEGQTEIWVNNAGVDLLTTEARQADYADRLRLLLEIDVRSSLLLTRHVAEAMRARLHAAGHSASEKSAAGTSSSGCLLNIGWDQSERGMGGESGELFAASKAAIQAATRSFAVSYAPEVRINCIAPGWIRTAWGETAPQAWQDRVMAETPLKRWGEPEDIARLARFLVSDEAAYLTGQVVFANGGAER